MLTLLVVLVGALVLMAISAAADGGLDWADSDDGGGCDGGDGGGD
jgi:hypothetical protein